MIYLDVKKYFQEYQILHTNTTMFFSGSARPIWIGVNLTETAKAMGIVIRKRCDPPYNDQYVTGFKLQAVKNEQWKTIHVDVSQ